MIYPRPSAFFFQSKNNTSLVQHSDYLTTILYLWQKATCTDPLETHSGNQKEKCIYTILLWPKQNKSTQKKPLYVGDYCEYGIQKDLY